MQQTKGRLAASVLAAVFLPAGGAVALAAAPWMTSADRAAACYGTAVATALQLAVVLSPAAEPW